MNSLNFLEKDRAITRWFNLYCKTFRPPHHSDNSSAKKEVPDGRIDTAKNTCMAWSDPRLTAGCDGYRLYPAAVLPGRHPVTSTIDNIPYGYIIYASTIDYIYNIYTSTEPFTAFTPCPWTGIIFSFV